MDKMIIENPGQFECWCMDCTCTIYLRHVVLALNMLFLSSSTDQTGSAICLRVPPPGVSRTPSLSLAMLVPGTPSCTIKLIKRIICGFAGHTYKIAGKINITYHKKKSIVYLKLVVYNIAKKESKFFINNHLMILLLTSPSLFFRLNIYIVCFYFLKTKC